MGAAAGAKGTDVWDMRRRRGRAVEREDESG